MRRFKRALKPWLARADHVGGRAHPGHRGPGAFCRLMEDLVSELNKVVAHYANGKLVKGTTRDFFPNRPTFHLTPPSGPVMEIRCRELKAVFFVRDLIGDDRRRDLRGFVAGPAETPHGKKIAVAFKDGELLCGYTLTFTPERDGFFLFPSAPGSNNRRVYVMMAATTEVKAGPAAEELAQRHEGGQAA